MEATDTPAPVMQPASEGRSGGNISLSDRQGANLFAIVGSVVAWDSPCHARTLHVVIAVNEDDRWSPFTLRDVDAPHDTRHSDLRQASWKLVVQ